MTRKSYIEKSALFAHAYGVINHRLMWTVCTFILELPMHPFCSILLAANLATCNSHVSLEQDRMRED